MIQIDINRVRLKNLFFIFTIISCATIIAKQEPIILTSPIIEFIDGKSWGINGEAVGYMRQVGLNVIKMQFGEGQKDRVGIFVFDGKKYSIKDLVVYEKKLQQQSSSLSSQEHKRLTEKLNTWLEQVKDYFIKQVKPFMDQAQGAKAQVVILIGEWAEKRNRLDSHLLRWSQASEENEFTLFRNDINSFALLDQFCSDLICYLSDLMRSCPKANAQFEQLKEQFLAQQHRT